MSWMNLLAGSGSGGGGGSSLPPVTASDNGDVLTVVNGSWDKAAPSGGGAEPLIVTVTDDGNGNLVGDKTYNQVKNAYLDGQVVLFYLKTVYAEDDYQDAWEVMLSFSEDHTPDGDNYSALTPQHGPFSAIDNDPDKNLWNG